MPHPRDPSSAGFNGLKKELGLLVMEEQSRHNQKEIKAPIAD
jgi:NitT/TauT family transport system ATP-binding protein